MIFWESPQRKMLFTTGVIGIAIPFITGGDRPEVDPSGTESQWG